MKISNFTFPHIVIILALVGSTLIAWCAGEPKVAENASPSEKNPVPPELTNSPIKATQPAPDSQSQTNMALDATALEGQAMLGVKVSFEAKRQLLSVVLLNLQQQSGITLQANPDSPATKVRITARVKEMPLYKLLNAFSRMYGVQWAKTGDRAYTMLAGGLTAAQLKLLQVGDPYWFKSRERTPLVHAQRRQERDDLADEILNEVDVQQLRTDQGVPLSDLPVALQQKIRHQIQSNSAEALVETHNAVRKALEQEWILRFGIDPGVKSSTGQGVQTL